MSRDERVFLMGEDIGAYGGAFKVTEGFLKIWRMAGLGYPSPSPAS